MKQAEKHGSSTAKRGINRKKPTPPKVLLEASEFTARERYAIYKALTIVEGRLRDKPHSFTSPLAARAWLNLQLSTQKNEMFVGLFLDSQHRLIEMEVLARGTLDAATVYPRMVVQQALTHNAAAMIFAHNHPSGISEPSTADRALTQRLRSALAQVDIRVLDHFVVGGKEAPTSFAERGWL